jgi:antitoxin FitA
MAGVPKSIQIRDVPDDVHATLRARAAEASESLSDYVRHHVERLTRRPSIADVLLRADRRSRPAELDAESVMDAVREAREGRSSG